MSYEILNCGKNVKIHLVDPPDEMSSYVLVDTDYDQTLFKIACNIFIVLSSKLIPASIRHELKLKINRF